MSIADVAINPMAFWMTMKATLIPRKSRRRLPPAASMRTSAPRPTVVKNMRSRESFSVMLNDTVVPKTPVSIAIRMAIRPPPTTGAGMLNRFSSGTRATSARPMKYTAIDTSKVKIRSSSILRTQSPHSYSRGTSSGPTHVGHGPLDVPGAGSQDRTYRPLTSSGRISGRTGCDVPIRPLRSCAGCPPTCTRRPPLPTERT